KDRSDALLSRQGRDGQLEGFDQLLTQILLSGTMRVPDEALAGTRKRVVEEASVRLFGVGDHRADSLIDGRFDAQPAQLAHVCPVHGQQYGVGWKQFCGGSLESGLRDVLLGRSDPCPNQLLRPDPG